VKLKNRNLLNQSLRLQLKQIQALSSLQNLQQHQPLLKTTHLLQISLKMMQLQMQLLLLCQHLKTNIILHQKNPAYAGFFMV